MLVLKGQLEALKKELKITKEELTTTENEVSDWLLSIDLKVYVRYWVWGQDGLSWSIKTHKKRRGQHPAILTQQPRSIKDLFFGQKKIFLEGKQRAIPKREYCSILPALDYRICFILATHILLQSGSKPFKIILMYRIVCVTSNRNIFFSSAKQREKFAWNYKTETAEKWKTVQTVKQRWGLNKYCLRIVIFYHSKRRELFKGWISPEVIFYKHFTLEVML